MPGFLETGRFGELCEDPKPGLAVLAKENRHSEIWMPLFFLRVFGALVLVTARLHPDCNQPNQPSLIRHR
jgi:hypothetical protein